MLAGKKDGAAKDGKKVKAQPDVARTPPATITLPTEPRALAAVLVEQLGRDVAKQVRAALEELLRDETPEKPTKARRRRLPNRLESEIRSKA